MNLASFGALYKITNYYYQLILFCYPIFEIYNNSNSVNKENCFLFKSHFLFIISQLFYPIILRIGIFSFLQLHTDLKFILIFLLIEMFLIGIMFCQKVFGRNFYLNKLINPSLYCYRRKIENLEKITDCSICCYALTEPIGNDSENRLIVKNYFETPCEHKFHEYCLKKWMEERLMCPNCRASIPIF